MVWWTGDFCMHGKNLSSHLFVGTSLQSWQKNNLAFQACFVRQTLPTLSPLPAHNVVVGSKCHAEAITSYLRGDSSWGLKRLNEQPSTFSPWRSEGSYCRSKCDQCVPAGADFFKLCKGFINNSARPSDFFDIYKWLCKQRTEILDSSILSRKNGNNGCKLLQIQMCRPVPIQGRISVQAGNYAEQ